MHALHARLPKHFVLEERLERYADAIESSPASCAGSWTWSCHPLDSSAPQARFRELRLDMGCGKGSFTVEAAAQNPDVLFVGIDSEPICIAYAAQKAIEAGLNNVVFCPGLGSRVCEYFAPGEVSFIYLNFPTPFPRKKEALQRLTHEQQLRAFRRILKPKGSVLLKTDSFPLREFSRTQFKLAGYSIDWESNNAREERPSDPKSLYEERLSEKGAKVLALQAHPLNSGPLAPNHPLRHELSYSLSDYLPENLEDLDYVPHGMEGTVLNLRNQKRNAVKDIVCRTR